jgi:hypothetical protein
MFFSVDLSPFLVICAIHRHFIILTSHITGFSSVASHSSELLIVCGHFVPTILHKPPLTNGRNLAVIRAVTFHYVHSFLFSVSQQPNLGPGRLLYRSLDNTQLDTHTHTLSLTRVIGSSQRPLPTQHTTH